MSYDAGLSLVVFFVVATLLSALSEQSRRSTLRARAVEERLAFLVDASAVFASSLNHAKTLATMTRQTVPSFADWCTVNLTREDGSIDRIVAQHVDPESHAAIREAPAALSD